MTTAPQLPTEPQSPTELLMAPDPTAKSRRRRSEFWQACWLISLSSLMISLYAIFLSSHLAPAASKHDLEQSALMLAHELSKLSVKHARFGNVGLVDFNAGSHEQIGLNRLAATIRLDGLISKQLGYEKMGELVAKDATDVAQLAREFARLEREFASPAPPANSLGHDSFNEIVRRVLSRTGAGGRLKSLHITLGTLKKSAKANSNMPLPAVPGENAASYADGESYGSHVPVQLWGDVYYEFYELNNYPRLYPPSQFEPLKSEDEVASTVLVEADFEVAERGKFRRIQKMQACALVGAPHPAKPALVFMLSFPQGYFSQFATLGDLFAQKNYNGVNGDWLQAIVGAIPDIGHFVKPIGMQAAPPQTAAMRALYDYLLCLGPEVVPANVRKLLNEPVQSLHNKSIDQAAGVDEFNCGLFKDTGAARFALQKQSFRDGAGQRALKAACSGESFSQLMPPYTFPLLVDQSGAINIPHENGFDKALVKEFLDALYQTNIAGIESMQISDTIVQRMQNSIEKSEKAIDSLKEELRSARHSIETLNSSHKSEAETLQLKRQIDSLSISIQLEQDRKSRFEKIKAKALMTAQNGRQAARSSYEIGSHMCSFVAPGIKRITAPFHGFLLGGRSVAFIPHTSPVDEDDIYEPAVEPESESDLTGTEQNSAVWLSHKFRVTDIPEPGMFVDNRPIIEYWQATPVQRANPPLFIMLSSSELFKNSSPSLFASRVMPFDFDKGVVGKSQLCYYAPQSVEIGTANQATCSVLIRDLVYSMSEGSGKPLYSQRPRWCLELGMDEETCPGLAVELQIRSPLPSTDNGFSGTYLQDPDGGQAIPLYPPLPADLL